MKEITLNEDNKNIEISGAKKCYPKSLVYIEGKVLDNKGDFITLSNVKFGIVVDKKTQKLKKAISNLDKLKINLNFNNKLALEKDDYAKLGIIGIKSLVNPNSNYQLIKKKYYFKIIK